MKRALPLSALLAVWAAAAPAQLIPIRTVPVSQSHQFEIFPSYTLAMGGVSIAVRDSLLDPFNNPATGARVHSGRFFGSPGIYSVSSQAGAGRTLPLGALVKSGTWHGGVSVALQEVDFSDVTGFPVGPLACPACESQGIDFGPPERSHGNAYAFAMLGKELPAAGLSVGGSILWAGLNAVDGVDLLYANSARIKQSGHAVDFRFGALKEWTGDRSLEAVVVHNRYRMTHDVFYVDNFWDPGTQQFMQRPRVEQNLDRTSTWGFHLGYEHPIAAPGWRLGWIGTVNRKSHPKIPNYELMNIPRDPGYSSAFNIGVGISKTYKSSTFAIDLIYEPIWSHTWADSEDPIETILGDTIQPGGMTIENHFRFANALLQMGLDQQIPLGDSSAVAGLQLGVAVRQIHYWLDQEDHVQITARSQEERWVEWSPTWGVNIRFAELELRYRGRITNGTGRPGVFPDNGFRVDDAQVASPSSDVLIAPSGPLTLTDVRVMSHQFSISVPLR